MAHGWTISGTVNADQSGAAKARSFRSGSTASVAHQPPHVGGVGAGPQQITRISPNNSAQHSRNGPFGVPSITDRPRRHEEAPAATSFTRAVNTDAKCLAGHQSIGRIERRALRNKERQTVERAIFAEVGKRLATLDLHQMRKQPIFSFFEEDTTLDYFPP